MRRINNIAYETARILLSIKAITLSPKKPYRFTSGILSPIYIDNRLIISYPKIRKKLIDFYINLIKTQVNSKTINFISGTATAALPQASLIAYKLKKPMIYVEIIKGEKNKTKIGGKLRRLRRGIVIEDHITTGGSSLSNVLAIRKIGGIINNCFAITSYEMKEAKKVFKTNAVNVYSLTTISYILNIAAKDGYIKKSEKDVVREWTLDPKNWGKKFGFE